VDASKVVGVIDDIFTHLEGLPVIRRLPRIKKRLEELRNAAEKDVGEIAGNIPEGSPWGVIADAVITWLEKKYPAWKTELEWVRVILDALLAKPPANATAIPVQGAK